MPVDAEDAMLSIQNEPSRSGCCCVAVESIPKCTRCGPSWFICCMKVTRSDWTQFAILRATQWEPGGACPPIFAGNGEVYSVATTNICGGGRAWWGNHGFDSQGMGYPFTTGAHEVVDWGEPYPEPWTSETTCRKPSISFGWVISEDCKTLSVSFHYRHIFRHEGVYYIADVRDWSDWTGGHGEYPSYTMPYHAWTQDRTLDFPYTITTDDPEYRALYNVGHPDFTGPIPQVTFTVSLCDGVGETNLPDIIDNDVKLFGQVVWYCDAVPPTVVMPSTDTDFPIIGRGRGNDFCGSRYFCPGEAAALANGTTQTLFLEIYWELLPDLETIRLSVVYEVPGGGSATTVLDDFTLIGTLDIPYNGGIWPSEGPWEISGFFTHHNSGADFALCAEPWTGTFIIQRVTSCEIPECGSLDCFPPCISSTVGCDGVTPFHSLLFFAVAGVTYNFPYDEGENGWYAQVTVPCGLLTVYLYCDGGTPTLALTLLDNLGTEGTNTQAVTVDCEDGEMTTLVQGVSTLTSADACDTEVTEVTIFSNNNGLL